jgi:molybdate transport system substrate-binding protein
MRIKRIAPGLLALVAALAVIACRQQATTMNGAAPAPKRAETAGSTQLTVMISGGLTAAYLEVAPEFERTTGIELVTSFGASMGTASDAIPVRLERGERADVLIMVDYALAELIERGKVVPGSRVELARSGIGVAVRAGAPRPDIGSVEALKRALLAAKSIAYSASASGRYISTELFPRLGIADQVMGKSRQILSERVGAVVARGEAEIGFQQISELLPIPGIDYVGPLPPELQKITSYSAGITVNAEEPEAARALIQFLATSAAPAIANSGMEPVTPSDLVPATAP